MGANVLVVGFMLEPGNGYPAPSPSAFTDGSGFCHHFKGMA
jgi:hypothetical protein